MEYEAMAIREFNLNQMVTNPSILCIGKRGSGKSFLLRDLLYHFRNIPAGIIISPTERMHGDHKRYFPDLYIHDNITDATMNNILLRQSEMINKAKQNIDHKIDPSALLIMENCLSSKKEWSKNKIIQEIMINGRHYYLTNIVTMQCPMGISPDMRLNFDYVFLGEADLGIVDLADGKDPRSIPGIVDKYTVRTITDQKNLKKSRGIEVRNLDSLPFPDWSMVDYKFYAFPSYARIKTMKSASLDIMMGRGCINKCSFCAYRVTSSVRYYSAEYLIQQMQYMIKNYQIHDFYFLDGSIGNNPKLLKEFCNKIIETRLNQTIKWYGNIRVDQVDEDLLKNLWKAGCRYLFYGFESGSQRILDLMNKGVKVEDNYRVANIHNKLKFPYNASMIFGYPGEREEDILMTMKFLKEVKPPSVGINCYVPLPGSSDYYQMLASGKIKIDDPSEWRHIGECNPFRIYADIPEDRFKELLNAAYHFAYTEIPLLTKETWGNTVQNIDYTFLNKGISWIRKILNY